MFGAVGEKALTGLLKLYSTCPEEQSDERVFQHFRLMSLKVCNIWYKFSSRFPKTELCMFTDAV